LFAATLGSMKLNSIEQVNNLKTLQVIVAALEEGVPRDPRNAKLFVILVPSDHAVHKPDNVQLSQSTGAE
jgi:hypothetical protein